MKTTVCSAMLLTSISLTSSATTPEKGSVQPSTDGSHQPEAKLTLLTGAGFMTSGGAHGAAVNTGVRYAVGNHFALGFDLGYGLMAAPKNAMQDRWWYIPSMAVVIPTRIGNRKASFDIGMGLGLGTSSGYTNGWAEYAARPFAASWEFQLAPTPRAHVIAAMTLSPSLEIFARADAAALVLPKGSNASVTDSTWILFSLGTRFRLL